MSEELAAVTGRQTGNRIYFGLRDTKFGNAVAEQLNQIPVFTGKPNNSTRQLHSRGLSGGRGVIVLRELGHC